MHEVIISNILTGRVYRKHFASRERADRHVDGFFVEPHDDRPPRLRRNYRVEVAYRPEAHRPRSAA